MSRSACRAGVVSLVAMIASATAAADESADDATKLSGSINASYYAMRDEPDFGVGVAAINRGPLRFEARYNYEAKHATSTFVGWKLSGGDTVTYEVTPIAGVLFGSAHGVIPGVEATVAYKAIDAYVEAEYVIDSASHDNNYFYAWSELGFRPVEWLRLGFVGQRTRVVHTDRDLQRGVFAQVTYGAVTVSAYAFNPDDASRYWVLTIGATF